MSEPLQLIARIPMTSDAYRRYLNHHVEPVISFPEIEHWLGGKRWHGSDSPAQIAANARHGMAVREWVASFTTGPYAPAPEMTVD